MAPFEVAVCGPVGCVTVPVVDAGPSLALQRAGRGIDLSPDAFVRVCSPLSRGICHVTIERRETP
jgi:expansin (peptidoglycan-binding protein)